ncbi:PapD-like protein [Halteromyces radiatus]|uniref:PapD-like protein n=1 Tax=Halteromyces radiatus TaxID=101107 RepID=UPI0022204471|nr:PapD-like protein [Halteromyces radiatus]KAI8086130.1 PapD-like protein [Halteromyces radiatus]
MSLIIEPSDLLTFKRPLTNVTKETLLVKNPNNEPVIFKVKTTAPKQYCVRPNAGRIDGLSQVEVQVILQPFKVDPPLDLKCKDKFLVQSAPVQSHEYDSMPVTDIWARIETQEQAIIKQHKIKCAFVPAATTDNITSEAQLPHIIETSEQKVPDVKPTSVTQENHSTISDNSSLETPYQGKEKPKEEEFIKEVPVVKQPEVIHQVEMKPTSAPVTTTTDRDIIQKDKPIVMLKEEKELSKELPTVPISSSPPAPAPTTTTATTAATTTLAKETKDDSDYKDDQQQKLRQELVAAQEQIKRLERELEQSKQDLEGLRLRQNATTTTTAIGNNTIAGTRKLPPTVQPLDAVHQHLAQLQKPHPVEGYPPQVVAIMCGVIFLFTYLFF